MERTTMPAAGETTTIPEVIVTIGEPIGFGNGALHAAAETYEEASEDAERAKQYLVLTSKHAPGQCIDGRCCKTTEAGTETSIGPKVAGGPALTMLAAIEATGIYAGLSAQQKTAHILTLLTAAGMKSGAHTTVTARKNNFKNPDTGAVQTGCGAAEQFSQSMHAVMSSDGNVLRTTAALVHGKADSESLLLDTKQATQLVDYRPDEFYVQVAAQYGGAAAELLEGAHQESIVIFNMVPNTTIDRDAFYRDTGKQAFVVDVWYIHELVEAIAYGRPDADQLHTPLLEAMVAFQVATYANLCDGSHRAVILSAQQEQTV